MWNIEQRGENERPLTVEVITGEISEAVDRRNAIIAKTKKLAWVENLQGQMVGFSELQRVVAL